MPQVADRTIGGKYQEMLVREGKRVYPEMLAFYLKALNQDGFLAGTVELKGDELEQAAFQTVQRLRAKAPVEGLTPREQTAFIEATKVLDNAQ